MSLRGLTMFRRKAKKNGADAPASAAVHVEAPPATPTAVLTAEPAAAVPADASSPAKSPAHSGHLRDCDWRQIDERMLKGVKREIEVRRGEPSEPPRVSVPDPNTPRAPRPCFLMPSRRPPPRPACVPFTLVPYGDGPQCIRQYWTLVNGLPRALELLQQELERLTQKQIERGGAKTPLAAAARDATTPLTTATMARHLFDDEPMDDDASGARSPDRHAPSSPGSKRRHPSAWARPAGSSSPVELAPLKARRGEKWRGAERSGEKRRETERRRTPWL